MGEFDFQTFPTLNLLFSNNKFYVNHPVTSQSHSSTLNHLSSTKFKVNLLSKKRLPNCNLKIPKVNCSAHHLQSAHSSGLCTSSLSMAFQGNDLNGVTQPVSIRNSQTFKQIAAKSFFKNSRNAQGISENSDCRHYFLPHWSSIMATPSHTNIKINELLHDQSMPNQEVLSNSDLNELTPDTTPLHSPTQQQMKSLKLSSCSSQNKKLANWLTFTSPTYFPSKFSLLSNDYEAANGTNPNTSLISQSPKVLLSNHQLVDLCSYTQNQLRLTPHSENKLAGRYNFQDEEKNIVILT